MVKDLENFWIMCMRKVIVFLKIVVMFVFGGLRRRMKCVVFEVSFLSLIGMLGFRGGRG